MPLKTTDPTTGEDRYSTAWIMSIAAVLFLLGFSFFYFAVLKRKQLKADVPAVSVSRPRTDEALLHSEPPSVLDERKKGQEFLNQVGDYVDQGEVQTEALSQTTNGALSNTGGRFTRELNSERLNRLAAHDKTADEPSDDYTPSAYSYVPTKGTGAAEPGEALGSGGSSYRGVGNGRIIDTVPNISNNGANGQPLQASNGAIQILQWGGGEEASGAASSVSKLVSDAFRQSGLVPVSGTNLGGMNSGSLPMPVGQADSSKNHISVNSVPTGTQLSVVLMNNVISSSIKQRVWAITTQELVFRRQVQLPVGVLLGGWQSGTPVREQLDVTFDLMVFPDGTELPISAFGVNGYSPVYPGLEGMRGLVDRYVEPPGWTLFLPVLLDFVSGYTQDALSGQVVVSNGAVNQARSPKEAMNKAVNTAVMGMHAKVMVYLERYMPYVHLRRGMPFKIELESSTDFSLRTLGARSYEDTIAAVKSQNLGVVQQLQQMPVNPPSAPEFLGVGNQSTSAADLRSQLQAALAAGAALKQN